MIGCSTLNNIAEICRVQGNAAKALEYHEQVVVIRQEAGDHVGAGESCWNIGHTYKDLGDLAQAEEYISLAVQIAEKIGHPALEQFRDGLKQVRAARRRA
ncbi:MAG: tetratricopeptide repeat protein [Candidatus Electrothrix sp. GM3_4]|nr:tetratricopeptide repeat protein [Candidatus Electrothrix sp. GM3_4]